jgi:hypothetical protein
MGDALHAWLRAVIPEGIRELSVQPSDGLAKKDNSGTALLRLLERRSQVDLVNQVRDTDDQESRCDQKRLGVVPYRLIGAET